ncbi:hypothetical protein FIBSPDRAFT_885513 [Athelia psychrophila]|uniref:Uncharacterized protein n=1 Tax=Athelia psychrophila TaxID=1759441 RepID=A0A166RU47_9AGAM|nr:hypothetical protein FIBSPDRAFT_885513 [Fibularhizoctonia sp. CBS 109695]
MANGPFTTAGSSKLHSPSPNQHASLLIHRGDLDCHIPGYLELRGGAAFHPKALVGRGAVAIGLALAVRAAVLAGACGHAVKPDRGASNTPSDVCPARKLTASPLLQPAPPIVVLEPTLRPYTHAVPGDALFQDLLVQNRHDRLKRRKG